MAQRLNPAARKALEDLESDGGGDLYHHLIGVYMESSIECRDIISGFPEITDRKLLKNTAHSWKSSSKSVGAEILANLCDKLEKSAMLGEPTALKSMIHEILDEYSWVEDELKRQKKAA